jgi:hypothetical protein
MPNVPADAFEFMFPSEIWAPVGSILGGSTQNATTILTAAAIGYAVLFYIDKTKEIPGAWNPWVIFWIVVILIVVFLIVAYMLSPVELPYIGEVLSAAPNSCVGNKSSLEDGLCYNNCRQGYHGYGVRCYVDSVDVGVGTPVGLEPCPENTDGQGDWTNMGLTCTRWKNQCHLWGVPSIKQWWTGCAETVGRLDHGGVCPGPADFDGSEELYPNWKRSKDKPDPTVDPVKGMESAADAAKLGHKQCADVEEVNRRPHTEYVDGLCYAKCPPDYPLRIPGMPYKCYKGGELSYDRGGGSIPPMFRFLHRYPVNIPPHIPVDNTPT